MNVRLRLCLASTFFILATFNIFQRTSFSFAGLFINMIHRLNEQVLDSPDSAAIPRERKQEGTQRRNSDKNVTAEIQFRSDRLSPATSTLRNLVEENAKKPNSTQLPVDPSTSSLLGGGIVSEEANNGEDGDDDDSDIDRSGIKNRPPKRSKII